MTSDGQAGQSKEQAALLGRRPLKRTCEGLVSWADTQAVCMSVLKKEQSGPGDAEFEDPWLQVGGRKALLFAGYVEIVAPDWMTTFQLLTKPLNICTLYDPIKPFLGIYPKVKERLLYNKDL